MFVPFFAFLGLILLLPLYFVAIWSFDELVRSEYTFHRQGWEQDGKPWGRTWRPPERQRGAKAKLWPDLSARRWSNQDWASLQASLKFALVWLFRTPAWMRRDRKTLRLVALYRLTAFVFAAAVAAYPITAVYTVVRALVATFS